MSENRIEVFKVDHAKVKMRANIHIGKMFIKTAVIIAQNKDGEKYFWWKLPGSTNQEGKFFADVVFEDAETYNAAKNKVLAAGFAEGIIDDSMVGNEPGAAQPPKANGVPW